MRPHVYSSELWLPSSIERVFAFFSDAANLEKLTPRRLAISIQTPRPIEMRRGTLIRYQLRIHGFPVKWETEITAWEPPGRFVDEQRRGPYTLWVHEHTFIAKGNGTLARDHVRYAVPGGWLMDRLLVRRDLEKIFAFRREQLQKIFGKA
jgi:ligand-binding SRPBCC domain-containing protein